MICSAASERFPKSARLRTKKDFSFRPYRKYQSKHFLFLFTLKGQGRIGVSLSKKVLRRAVARNRVRRLLRESFRLNQPLIASVDLHVIGLANLKPVWQELRRSDVTAELQDFLENVQWPKGSENQSPSSH